MMTALLLLALQHDVTVVNAVPGAIVHLIRVPPEVKDPASFVKLWSDNDAARQEALAALSDAPCRWAPARLRELARLGSPQVQALARLKVEKLGDVVDPKPVAHRAVADIDGAVRFSKVDASTSYHLFATRPLSADVHRPDVKAGATVDLGGATPPAGEAGAMLLRVSQGDRVLAELALAPGRPVEVPVAGPTVRLEWVDAVAEAERVGKVQLVHRLYGVFVKLDPGFAAGPGEEIVIVRDGKEVARSKVVRVASADETYPDGAIQLSRDKIEIRKGDEIRRLPPK